MFKSLAHNIDNQPRTNDVYTSEDMDFAGMLLSQDILSGLNSAGFKKPSPIQIKAIPLAMCGFDLIVQSKSGTGKTVVFSIVALETLSTQIKDPQVLILTPTREIAVQIQHVLSTIGSELKDFKAEYFIGGLPIAEDKQKLLNKSIHVAIGAPGRIKSLIENKHLKTKKIKLFILDEADKLMLESFKSDIDFINNSLPTSKQIIATSATYPDELDNLIAQYMKSPTKISIETDIPTLLGLKQFVSLITRHLNIVRQIQYKTNELTRILSTVPFKQCIVFTNYQIRAESLSNDLNKTGWPSTFISASQTQAERLIALKKLKNHDCRLLISTDLIARGIDAENVNLVINYDIPYDGATYLHRIGRAGRYGSLGLCITICCNGDEYTKFKSLISTISTDIELLKLPTNESMPSNLWKCDNSSFEKISFNQSLKENTLECNNDSSNTYQIQSDNILKISDLQEESEMISVIDSHLKSTIIQQENKRINESSNKVPIEIVVNEVENSNFGAPMLQDLSTTPEVLAIQKNKLLIKEKNLALLSIASLLVNKIVNSKFESFKFFENLMSNNNFKLSENSVKNINGSKSTNLQNFINKYEQISCLDVNQNGDNNYLEKIANATVSNGFKSFAELKTSVAINQNVNGIENRNTTNQVKTDGFKIFNDIKNGAKDVHLDGNQNGNNDAEKPELGKTQTLENGFKSFEELKTSVVSRTTSSVIENGNIMDKVETKGFKSFEDVMSDSKSTNIESFDNLEGETSLLDGNKNGNNHKAEKSEIEKMTNQTIENCFKSFAELKTSVVSQHNRSVVENGNIMHKVEAKGFQSFKDIKNICNGQNNYNEMVDNENQVTKSETLKSPQKKVQFADTCNSKQHLVPIYKPEISGFLKKPSINHSNHTDIDKENVSDELELVAGKVEVNNPNFNKKQIQNTKIDDNVVSKLSYLLSLLQIDTETYIENKAKLKKVHYKIILDALLNNISITLENLTKSNDFVRIIESKIEIDSTNSTKQSRRKEADKSKSIRNLSHKYEGEPIGNPSHEGESMSNYSRYDLEDSDDEVDTEIYDSKYYPIQYAPKCKATKSHFNANQKVYTDFSYLPNSFSGAHYSNKQYELGYISRLAACPTCRCLRNCVVNSNTPYPESKYSRAFVNTPLSDDNYYDTWYRMWNCQMLHIRHYARGSM